MNLLDLFVKISVDTGDVDKGFSETSSKAETLAMKLKSGLATAAKVGTAALTAAATGVAALTKASIDQYAEYDQLVGGAKLMFGEAYDYIADKAKNAYSTVQMSQNDYLQQVNGFATGLKTALGGNEQAAAELADRIINAEADVVAATGNSQEAVQNAFNGIMKSNYTMLDNLQIGITPTKEGFQEVIDKVNEWNAADGRATEYQIENLADCQSALVDYIEMVGMQGYASREAADTIQGSVASMKGAWSNLLTGIADENADFKTLTSNFVDSLVAVGKNIIPRISVILGGISQLVTSASTTIIPMVITTITDNLPDIIILGAKIVSSLASGIVDNLPAIVDAAISIVFQLANSLIEGLPNLIETLVQITTEIVNKFTDPDFMIQLIDTALQIIMALAQGLIDAVPDLLSVVPTVIANLLAAFIVELPNIIEMGINLISALIDGIIKSIPVLIAAIPNVIIGFVNGILKNLDRIILAAPRIILALITGILGAIPELIAAVPRIISAISDTISNYSWADIGGRIVAGLRNGIAALWEDLRNWFVGKVNALVGSVKNVLGIHSPSRVFAGIGENMALGLGSGWKDEFDSIKRDITGDLDFGTAKVGTEYSVAGRLQGAISSIGNIGGDFNIVVQSVLDGKVIGETAYNYNRKKLRAGGT